MDIRRCEVCHLGIEGGRLMAFLDAGGWHVLHADCFQGASSGPLEPPDGGA